MDRINKPILDNDEVAIIYSEPKPKRKEFATSGDIAGSGYDNQYVRPKKQPSASGNYVTKKFFVFALIIAMIISSGLGAFVAIKVSSQPHTYKNLSSNSLDNATGSKLTISQIIDKNENSVVEITTKSTQSGWGATQVSEGAGSGVIVKENGYIVTNNHVIEGATSISVRLHNGKSHTATVVGADPVNDIAVIKIAADKLDAVTIGDSAALNVGDMTVAIGNPLGQLGGTATAGIVSALERTLTIDGATMTLLQTDAAINPGNSGGGLFGGNGDLVGIVVAKSSGTGIEGLGFAIPINSVADEIDEIITDGKVSSKPVIGIQITDVGEEQAKSLNKNPGVYIIEVTSEEAKSAGLEANDRLVSINGKEINGSKDFIAQVRKLKIGDTVTLVIERDGKELTIKTKLIAS